MAVSDVTHFNLLNRWPSIMHVNQFNFNQASGLSAPLNSPCKVWIQPERDVVAQSLYMAGHQIAENLGFYPRPTWVSETFRLGRGWPYTAQEYVTKYKYVEAFGQRATSLITANVAVTYTCDNSTGVDNVATISGATTVTDPNEIQFFFRVADGAPGDGSEYWQIEPMQVTIASGVFTAVGSRALFVQPSVWKTPFLPSDPNYIENNGVDIAQPGNFVTLVDVYRVYNDTTVQAQYLSDPIYSQTSPLTPMLTDTGVVLLIESGIGNFRVRPDSCTGCHNLEWVKVFYKAGFPLVNGAMDRRFETALIRFANVLFPYYPSEVCDNPNGPTRTMFDEDRSPLPRQEMQPGDLHSPLGLSRGAVRVWRALNAYQFPTGGKI